MSSAPQLLLIGAVAAVGVLHTIVPDHWVPIALIARQRGWSRGETARASLLAGIGHAGSTLLIAVAVWIAGVAFATRFGNIVDDVASIALIGFGGWIAIGALREMHGAPNPAHTHGHHHDSSGIGENDLHETGHALGDSDHDHRATHRDTHESGMLFAPEHGTVVAARHFHIHRHGPGAAHAHWHDHGADTLHVVLEEMGAAPPLHEHDHRTPARTALLLILGSSPMVEGIPAFFAAAKYGFGLIVVMAAVFGLSTIAAYVLLCVYSTEGLQRVRLGAVERYGEVLSGAFIALVGLVFWFFPIL